MPSLKFTFLVMSACKNQYKFECQPIRQQRFEALTWPKKNTSKLGSSLSPTSKAKFSSLVYDMQAVYFLFITFGSYIEYANMINVMFLELISASINLCI